MKKITTLLTLSLAAMAFLLAGCNTARGFGQDLQKVGEKIEDKAKK
ncbi:MAG: entericidin A/B family lipoprotein [Polaromonas sp.]|jgi:predicted small secreted protein|nr:entericidin A/B family lipoprotein [Polaromonas sp.]